MKIAAIIAEYNPFHNGHALHIQHTRAECGATHVVAIMSGDFVQRGDAACIDKHARALMALRGGVDLVVELPLPWAMAGAETFARGGVGLAAGLGCVDALSFGSECGSLDLIQQAARRAELPEVSERLRLLMDSGMSYAAARAKAMEEFSPELSRVMCSPNDTLGVEYCRALDSLAPYIQPFCVTRVGAAHDSSTVSHGGAPVSASYLRQLLSEHDGREGLELLRPHMPDAAYRTLDEHVRNMRAPADISRLDRTLVMVLRGMTAEQFARLPDVSEGLENRIAECAALGGANAGFSSLADNIKCKRYTHARIRRILLSALLGMTADDSAGTPPYIRVLGMNSRGKEILSAASEKGTLPIVTRYAQMAALDERSRRIFSLCASASDIHGLTLPTVPAAGRDHTQKLIVEK